MMRAALQISLFVALAVPAFAISAAETSWQLSAAEWSRPRSGLAVQEMEPVAAAVRAWHTARQAGGATLVLVHAGGEEGSLWAEELRDWLVALAVPPTAIELLPGGVRPDRMEIRVKMAAANPVRQE